MDIGLIESFREGNRLEAKSARGGLPRSIWGTYSAFANTNGGCIVLGVSEGRARKLEVTGVESPEDQVKRFWDSVNNPSKASANILTDDDVSVAELGGRKVIAITVPRARRQQRPVFVGGNPATGTFRRNGEGDYRCTPEEYRAMVRDSSEEAQDSALVDWAEPGDLCRKTMRSYRSALATARPNHPWLQLPQDDMLIRLGALGRLPGEAGLRPTRAGLLMFGYEHAIVREFPSYFLDYREAGASRRWEDRVVSNDGEWSGNVFDFWSNVSPRLATGLKRPFELGADMARIEDLPMHKAVREGLANCLIHADYFGRLPVVIVRHDDRIEFSNPGSLRLDRETVLEGGTSDARNPTLMKMFGLINICERAGGGYDAMRSAVADAGAAPLELTESFNPDRTEPSSTSGLRAPFPASFRLQTARRRQGRKRGAAWPPRSEGTRSWDSPAKAALSAGQTWKNCSA